jgi:endonuclease/exonuclease/phosphatase family metal-dependent hydrolase
MKTLFLLLSVVLLASSCGNPSETPAPKPPTSKYQKYAKENEIKIMSFNVRTSAMDKETPNHWDNRKEACIALIKDQKPTIIGFQEAVYSAQWVWIKDQLKSEGYDGYGVNRQTGKESGSGECPGILYDKSVIKKIEVGTFWLSETPDTPSKGWDARYYRTATWGLFEHLPTGKQFFYINTHLDHESVTAQVEGMKLIANKFKEYQKEVDAFSSPVTLISKHPTRLSMPSRALCVTLAPTQLAPIAMVQPTALSQRPKSLKSTTSTTIKS